MLRELCGWGLYINMLQSANREVDCFGNGDSNLRKKTIKFPAKPEVGRPTT